MDEDLLDRSYDSSKIGNTRNLRGIDFIDLDNEEYKEIL